MYLNNIIISESQPIEKVVRDISFKKGLNIIVDESTENDHNKGNNVGKTTFLKLIDICFGAKDKRYLWTDSETGSESTELKNYINKKKVFVSLNFTKEEKSYSLKTELFDRGKRFINGNYFPYPKYVDELNLVIFEIIKPPSFRQLIGKFVRVKLKQDNYTVLRYLDRAMNSEYRNIYEFLFKLSDHDDSAQKLLIEENIRNYENDLEKIIKLHNFSNVNDLEERKKIVQRTVDDLDSKIKKLTNTNEYVDYLDRSIDIKKQINELNDKINADFFKLDKIKGIISKETESDDEIDNNLLEKFYNEIKMDFTAISKQFKDLIDFNNKIKQNKIKYYKNRVEKISDKILEMTKQRDSIISQNKDVVSLINEDNYSVFESYHQELVKQSELLGELKKVLEIYQGLTKQLIREEQMLSELDSKHNENDNLFLYNSFLSDISQTIFGQRLYLSKDNKFPLKLSNIDDGVGTGHRKTITLLIDIAYVSFLNELDLNYPKFFVHDVLETIDEHNMKNIVNFIESNGSQFIFGVLNEKIKDYDFIDEADKILILNQENKLFKL